MTTEPVSVILVCSRCNSQRFYAVENGKAYVCANCGGVVPEALHDYLLEITEEGEIKC